MDRQPMEQRILNALKNRKELTATGICKHASIGKRDRDRLYRALDRMRKSGKLVCEDGAYAINTRADGPIELVVRNLHERFAFAQDEKTGEEFFIPGRMLLGALPGDRVLLRELPARGDLREGEVIEILEESDFTFTGVFHRGEGGSTIQPDKNFKGELYVYSGKSKGARDGDKVVARIYKRGKNHHGHKAQVLSVAGSAQEARACAQAILQAQGIEPGFREELLAQAQRIERAGITPQDSAGRLDLREEQILTIDGATSKDLDDAVSLRRIKDGWLVGVHIADVSHYVTARSPIDQEAFERGTSIYYADQVVPMLPPALSNGICSLNPGEERLALSAFITLDTQADITELRFEKTVIRSKVRGVYSEVNAILDGSAGEEILQKYGDFCDTLREMDALARLCREKRRSRGAIDLSSVESGFAFDEAGEVIEVFPRKQGAAENLVEEFMLLANQAAATFGEGYKVPFIYRIHENPPEAKVDALFELLHRLGLEVRRPEGNLSPSILRDVLESVRGKELETIVNNQILRSMAKARYSEKNAGHYGLTLRRYSHFTSPIRRYPDLAVHRIISDALAGDSAEVLERRYAVFAKSAAEQSSQRELRAMSVERDCDSCFMAQAMQRHVGQVFAGTVSGAAPHGLYVLLENSVEGLVRIQTMEDDDYEFDGAVALTGRRTGKRYRVGDPVRVLVVRADVSSGQVDFTIAEQGQ